MLQTEHEYKNSRGQSLSYRITLPDEEPVPPGAKYSYCIQLHGFSGCLDSDYVTEATPHILKHGLASVSFNMTGVTRHKSTKLERMWRATKEFVTNKKQPPEPAFDIATRHLTPKNGLDDTLSFLKHLQANHPELNHDKPAVIAPSFGAYTAICAAAEFDETPFSHMVFQSTVPNLVKPWHNLINYKLGGIEIVKAAWKIAGYVPQKILGHWQHIGYDLYEQFESINLKEKAEKLTCAVTFVQGDCDELAPLEDVDTLKGYMTNARDVHMHVIPGAPHIFKKRQFARSVIHTRDALLHTPELWRNNPAQGMQVA